MIRLELPHLRYEASFRNALAQFDADTDDTTVHYRRIDPERLDFSAYVQERLDEMHTPSGPGRVTATEFWIIDEEGYAGRMSLRHELNDYLARYGGHIGYDVVPDRRGRGYATEALAQCLDHARTLGLERVFLTCSDGNIASQTVIERNGGVLEGLDSGYSPPLRRYWIELG
jgi:predicted acetyltransferase